MNSPASAGNLASSLDVLAAISNLWLRSGVLFRERDSSPVAASAAQADHMTRIVRESPPWVASGKLMSAYDGARAAATLWRAGEVHVIADYALLRVVVEGAVLAWWISSEPNPDERAVRAYRVALDDLTNARNREQAAVRNAQTDDGREKRGTALAGVLRELDRLTGAVRDSGITIGERQLTPQLLKMPSLLVEAERRIEGAGDLGYSLLWSIASTTAHGSLTAVEQLSNMSTTGEPVALSDPETVGQFAAQAAHLLHAAHESWNRYAGHSPVRP